MATKADFLRRDDLCPLTRSSLQDEREDNGRGRQRGEQGQGELGLRHGSTGSVGSFGYSRCSAFPRAPQHFPFAAGCDCHNTATKMPDNVVQSPYPLIDADPHFSRVVRYMRPSDYAVWASGTAAFPSAIYFWGTWFAFISRAALTRNAPSEMADPTKSRLRPALRLGGVFGFIGGFLLAYQRSSCESALFVSS